jgi:hypothetical protein
MKTERERDRSWPQIKGEIDIYIKKKHQKMRLRSDLASKVKRSSHWVNTGRLGKKQEKKLVQDWRKTNQNGERTRSYLAACQGRNKTYIKKKHQKMIFRSELASKIKRSSHWVNTGCLEEKQEKDMI